MADIIIESVFGEDVFTWNHLNRVRADETRAEYLRSIREADKASIRHLITFART